MALYRWWPRYRPGSVELGGAGLRMLLRTAAMFLAVGALLALPPVARVTGVPPLTALLIMALYVACMFVNDYVLHPAAMRGPRGFHLQLVVTPLYNVFFLLCFVVIPGDPKTPLWVGPILYATATGAWQEIDPSFGLLALHVGAPLATIPIFLARGAPAWSWVGPILCAALSGLSYHGYANLAAAWRRMRAEQQATIDGLRARTAELERQQLARDLHDSVGSALAMVALYGDLIERHIDRADELKRVSATLREAAREGLGELRGVLDAMAPADPSLAELGASLRKLAQRLSEASGAEVRISVDGAEALALDAPVRLALVRVFQEALNNAVRHGRARRIEARLAAVGERVRLEIADDGAGFDPNALQSGGRGLAGMRARAAELQGSFELDAAPGRGTRVAVTLPVSIAPR